MDLQEGSLDGLERIQCRQLHAHSAHLPASGKLQVSYPSVEGEEKNPVACDEETNATITSPQRTVRRDLVLAHRLCAEYGMDELVWNHCSSRFGEQPDGGDFWNSFSCSLCSVEMSTLHHVQGPVLLRQPQRRHAFRAVAEPVYCDGEHAHL